MNKFDRELYERLLSEGLLAEDTLDNAIKEAGHLDVALPQYLLDNNTVSEDVLLTLMSDISNIPLLDSRQIMVEKDAIEAVPAKFTWYYKFVPLKLEGNKLTIAVDRPLSIAVQDELRLILGYQLSLVLAKKDKVTELMKEHYGLGADTVGRMVERVDEKPVEEEGVFVVESAIENIEKLAGDASVIRLVNQIIFEAYQKRATDIHIEPFRDKLRLRYRVDGVLQDQKVPEDVNRFLKPMLSRIKIMSNLDIVECRVPQDGRAIVKTHEEVLDLRISFIPTPHGESVVIRILPSKRFLSLEKLGLYGKDMDLVKRMIKKPSGIIFVTGPTGSGKTTTLYACLKEIDKTEKKIITIEDPIEYEIEDITQIQVLERSGLTFAKGLRSMLRHDPDIMMVGEVRDHETAEIAIRVALTGHLVLSTLHTNDAASGIMRLIDIGLEPYLVASSVEAFIAQRLVRVVCPNCKTEDPDVDFQVKRNLAEAINLNSDEPIRIFKGEGCEKCNFTGFYGRTAIYEILIMDQDIKKMITEKAAATEIKKKAMENGMRTLMLDGWKKVAAGDTTLSEVLKVCQDLDIDIEKDNGTRSVEDPATAGSKERSLDQFPGNKRLFVRLPVRLPLQYRIVEKGTGKIVRIHKEGGTVNISPDWMKTNDAKILDGSVMAADVSFKNVPEEEYFKEFFSVVGNISAGGLAFESQYMLPVDSVLELKMPVPGGDQPITCLAKIVRVEKRLPECFYIAVCFLDMSGEARNVINAFVEETYGDKQMIE